MGFALHTDHDLLLTIDHPDPVVIVGDSSGVDPDNGSFGAVEYRSRCSQVRCRWKKSTLKILL